MHLRILWYFFTTNLRAYRWYLTTILAWTIGMVLQKLGAGIIAAQATDHLVTLAPGAHYDMWTTFSPYLIGVIIAAFGGQLFIDLGFLGVARTTRAAVPVIHRQVFSWLLRQKLAYYADNFTGAITSQVTKFFAAHIAFTEMIMLNTVKMVVIVFASIAIIAFYSLPIALFLFCWTIIFTIIVRLTTKIRLTNMQREARAHNTLIAHIADVIGNISIVTAYAQSHHEKQRNDNLSGIQMTHKYTSWIYGIRTDVLFGAMMTVLTVTMLWLSLTNVANGHISIGTMLMIQVFTAQIIAELWGLSSLMRSIDNALADADVIGSALISEVVKPPALSHLRLTNGAIDIQHLTFAYDTHAVFSDLTLFIPAGQRVGLVGPSGSGKTTLTKLLLKFVEYADGDILIDHQSLQTISANSLRRQIAYVPQEPLLFHHSLHDNIAYARPAATKAEIIAAAKKAHAWEFIKDLPQGLDTLVGERGVKLSGGQRQRIAIARAILKDAPILILDEATSALDSESESLIKDALSQLMHGRTAIVIAHRLSTVQSLDRIIVLEKGIVREDGPHKTLVRKKGGIYAKLWRHQSGGFIDE